MLEVDFLQLAQDLISLSLVHWTNRNFVYYNKFYLWNNNKQIYVFSVKQLKSACGNFSQLSGKNKASCNTLHFYQEEHLKGVIHHSFQKDGL